MQSKPRPVRHADPRIVQPPGYLPHGGSAMFGGDLAVMGGSPRARLKLDVSRAIIDPYRTQRLWLRPRTAVWLQELIS